MNSAPSNAASAEFRRLAFFGRISASVSHDIKNCLAIINENAGLLEDIAHLANAERPLDPGRVVATAARVKDQVNKADCIVKNMNIFAHSADKPVTSFDLCDSVTLLLDLSARLAARKGAKISVTLPSKPLMVSASPFRVMQTLFGCIELALAQAGEEARLTVTATAAPPGAQVLVERDAWDGQPLTAEVAELAEAAGGFARLDENGSIVLELSETGGCPCSPMART